MRKLAAGMASAATVAAMILNPFGPLARAGTSVGSFEIDGNTPDSAPGEPLDWSDIGTDPTAHVTPFVDSTGSSDDGFVQGSKDSISGAWKCGNNSDPGKVDIKNGDIAFRTLNGKQYVYVDFTRATNTGDSHLDYEFAQSSSPASTTCTEVPKRSVGDVVITFDTGKDTTTGNKTLSVAAYRFTAVGGKADTFVTLGVGSQGATWDGAVSPDNLYGEAVLNLTDTIGTIACGKFAGAYMKSRSSTSLTAALQDYVGKQPINPGDCPQSSLTKEVRNVTTNGSFGPTADALPGQRLEYRLTYTNTGAAPATNVVISDQLSSGQTLVANSCTPTTSPCLASTTKPTWNFASIANGGAPTVITFQTDLASTFASLPTMIQNVGVVDTTEEQPKNSNTTTVNVNGTPNLTWTKQAYDSRGRVVTTVNPGDTVTYKVTVTNTGTAAGETDYVDNYDDLLTPSAVTSNDGKGSCTAGTIGADKVFNCDSGTVAPNGGSRVFTYTAQMPARIVVGDNRDPGCSNTDLTDYPITNVVLVGGVEVVRKTVCLTAHPILTPSKSASPTTVDAGGTVTYTVKVTNSGTAPGSDHVVDSSGGKLSNVTITENNSGWACSVTNNVVTCDTHMIDPGTSQQIKYTAQVPSTFTGTPGGGNCTTSNPQQYAVSNTATFTTAGSASATVCVNANPSFTIVKKVNGSSATIIANPGDTVTYTIEVKNTGQGPGKLTFPDDYDDHLTNVTTPIGDKGGTCVATTTNGNKGWSCTTALLNPGVTETFTYTAKLPANVTGLTQGTCGSGYFLVRNTISPDVHADVCIPGQPSITWTKKAYNAAGQEITGGTVNPDDVVTYKITVSNGGNAAGSSSFTDDYDDLLNPSTVMSNDGGGSCTAIVQGTNKVFGCDSGMLNPGASRTFTYTAQMPHQITVADNRTPGGPDCSATSSQSYPIKNVIVLDGIVITSRTVCVKYNPDLAPGKSLYSGTPAPGATVTYSVTVTNNGNAPGQTTTHDTSNGGLSNVTITYNPSGWTCSVVNNVIDCTTAMIDPGQTQQIRYTATLPRTFAGAPGSPNNTPCKSENPHEYPVVNLLTLGNGKTTTNTVCVPAGPQLTLTKSVARSTDAAGTEYLTYTLTWNNTGPAEATTATISENIPTGTSFVSCTGGCSAVTNGATNWTVGPVAPLNGLGSVTLTVAVVTDQKCTISNTAQIKFMNDTVVNSNTVDVAIVPKPHPENAHSSGNTIGAQVLVTGVVGVSLLPISTAGSSQNGLGVSSNSQTPISVSLGTVLQTGVLATTSTSRVTASPAAARNTSSAEVANVCLLSVPTCLVKADTIRASASTVATGSFASASTAGTTIQNLTVLGKTPAQIGLDVNATNTVTVDVDLITKLVISVNEVKANTVPGLYGSTYKAGITVTALHVKLLVLGLLSTEVIVSQATSYSDFPQLLQCTVGANQSVSGHAFIASVGATTRLTGMLADESLGYVELPPLGGSDSQHIVGASVLSGNAASAQVADSLTEGTVNPNVSSTSHSYAEIAGDGSHPACVLTMGTTCLVTATAIRSETSTTSNAGGSASTDAGTSFTDARVNIGSGIVIPLNPAPNTTITLPGLGYLVINEQLCDGGISASHTCTGAHHSGMTVRALHVVLNVLNNPSAFLAGADVIVAEAHSDGSFG